MDKVPYDFVDRVFAKLDDSLIEKANFGTPIWKEVTRVYKQKLQLLQVYVCWIIEDSHVNGEIKCKIADTTHLKTFTLDEALSLDSRFNRVIDFSIYGDGCGSMKDEALEEFSRILDYASRFESVALTFPLTQPVPPALLKCLMESNINPCRLFCNTSLGEEDALKKLLKGANLKHFGMLETLQTSTWSPSFYGDLEAFVCQPHFKSLLFSSDCFDDAAFQRIVAYWMQAKPTNEWSISTTVSSDMRDKLAVWLPSCGGNKFKRRIGEFELVVSCNSSMCLIDLKKQ